MYKQIMFALAIFIIVSESFGANLKGNNNDMNAIWYSKVLSLAIRPGSDDYNTKKLVAITNDNFRQAVSISKGIGNFFRPESDSVFDECVKVMSKCRSKSCSVEAFDCKSKKFQSKQQIDVDRYSVSLESNRPIDPEFLFTVINEMLVQEHFNYFTILRQHDYRIIPNQGIEQWKYCLTDTGIQSGDCLYELWYEILAYKDRDALRNGVIWDFGYNDDGLYIFSELYQTYDLEDIEANGTFSIIKTKLAYEVTHEVNPYLISSYNYKISRIVRDLDKEKFENWKDSLKDWKGATIDDCRQRITEQQAGRFTKQDENYCNCIGKKVEEFLRDIKYKKVHSVDAGDFADASCESLKSAGLTLRY